MLTRSSLSYLAGVSTALVGLLVLAGWWFDTGIQKSVPLIGISLAIQVLLLGIIFFMVKLDVKWRREAQELLREEKTQYSVLNAELEQRVLDRTADLESANKELEAFSYSVSHDLRAPLRAIDGYGRILVEDYEDRLDPEGRRVLGIISNETKRMGILVDDLLAFSRLGRQDMNVQNINMTGMAESLLGELSAESPGRIMQLELKQLPPVQGDRAMIRVMWTNFLSNAFKFTKNQNPAVIEIGSFPEDGQTVYYVKDNGVGFDMKYVHKLFGVFQRLHTAEEFDGTGVGLALAQRIVNRHGGRVWAEAVLNEGATFYFSLPRMDGEP
jgi:two-component system sensor kinase